LETNYYWNFYGRFNAVRFRFTASFRCVLFTVIDRRMEENGGVNEQKSERARATKSEEKICSKLARKGRISLFLCELSPWDLGDLELAHERKEDSEGRFRR